MKETTAQKLFGHKIRRRSRLGLAVWMAFFGAASVLGIIALTTSISAVFGFDIDMLSRDLRNIIMFAFTWAGFTLLLFSIGEQARHNVVTAETKAKEAEEAFQAANDAKADEIIQAAKAADAAAAGNDSN
jgi:hypothetical protein